MPHECFHESGLGKIVWADVLFGMQVSVPRICSTPRLHSTSSPTVSTLCISFFLNTMQMLSLTAIALLRNAGAIGELQTNFVLAVMLGVVRRLTSEQTCKPAAVPGPSDADRCSGNRLHTPSMHGAGADAHEFRRWKITSGKHRIHVCVHLLSTAYTKSFTMWVCEILA